MALNLTLTALGALSIWLNGQPWLDSGAIAVRDGGTYFSNDCSALHSADACRPMKADMVPITTRSLETAGQNISWFSCNHNDVCLRIIKSGPPT